METKTIEQKCQDFLNDLGMDTLNPRLFNILAEVARDNGISLCASQRGIAGTYIYFERIP